MDRPRSLPWLGIALAVIGALALLIIGQQFWLAVAILLLWIGSLWLASAEPPPVADKRSSGRLNRDEMAELIEFSGTPLMLTDRNRIVIANQAAREVLGAHIVNQDVRMALRHPEAVALADSDRPGRVIVKGLARRRDIWRISRQPLDAKMAVFELINHTAEADISRAHTDFVANASHELRTPLASIIGYVETLSEEDGDGDPRMRARFLATILREAKRLQGLVDDLMSLSRIEAEKHEQPIESVALQPLIERAARDAAGAERADRLIFELASDAAVPGDSQQLEQLVRNLIDNALKYGAENGPVRMTLANVGDDHVQLTVSDTGDGIPAEHLPHLTRRFYRTDPGRSRASGGTGLGLAIVKHIVERHRGRLDIDSKVGHGTTVTIRLPMIPAVEE